MGGEHDDEAHPGHPAVTPGPPGARPMFLQARGLRDACWDPRRGADGARLHAGKVVEAGHSLLRDASRENHARAHPVQPADGGRRPSPANLASASADPAICRCRRGSSCARPPLDPRPPSFLLEAGVCQTDTHFRYAPFPRRLTMTGGDIWTKGDAALLADPGSSQGGVGGGSYF